MTISYDGNFGRLLLRWKGSIWKDCWIEVVVFMALYYSISLLYRFILDDEQREIFEGVVQSVNAYTKQIPLTFLLGFFVSTVVKRWWDQFERVPWPDDLLSMLNSVIPGEEHHALLKRRTCARYVVLSMALCWRDICKPITQRFPTMNHFVTSGFMTPKELELFNTLDVEAVRWFLPLQWTLKIIEKDAQIRKTAPNIVNAFIKDMNQFRKQLRSLYCFDWICIPLVYTQVVTIATYGFFAMCIVGRQFLNPRKHISEFEADFYVPIISLLQLMFYVGWFKVAQHLMRPFGEDDDDIELSYLVDRNLRVGLAIVDAAYNQEPPLDPDPFCNRPYGDLLRHTLLSRSIVERERWPKCHVRLDLRKIKEAEDVESVPLHMPHKKIRGKHVREF